ncbi:MAG: glycine C-acetyltransferase [Acholeplasmatales bacterium]|jgi:glycine C-acetyltransferase|nr:glycine C-acetyltransferase [Acholeplasmataceae bacterium]MDY0115563.1 glycine C-acetyltransferase [Acholeplasmatales bacterium]MCK9233740.1 glycine C-acetyltransferase [Acholeplasmataceae bacterium]MCK9289022.1 glycine C-acetyltransferase [Acholeplasmataceae bacterium]MCK9427717.1 glycine C-acetyltransferase [Acholeplasmataceae bacterium]
MDSISKKLMELKDNKIFKLPPISDGPIEAIITLDGKKVINLSSNNYLGLANDENLKKAAHKAIDKYGVGAGAVRTIVGNMDIHEELDQRLANFKKEEAALVFQSGYMCNIGVIQAVTERGDLIISDELNHASIIDGVRLSRAEKRIFKHSDMTALETILKTERENFNTCLIITDGVFSMDGDIAKLPEIVKLAKKYHCLTYVDDAHGSGVLGSHGRGTVDHFNLHGEVDFIIGTLSKAIGVVGGYVSGKKEIREYLLNRGRPQLFSTTIVPAAAAAIIEALNILEKDETRTKKLWDNANYLKALLAQKGFDIGNSETPITPLIIKDEEKTIELSKALLDNGVFVSPIVFPTVPKGTARLRLMPSSMHQKKHLEDAVEIIYETAKNLKIV